MEGQGKATAKNDTRFELTIGRQPLEGNTTLPEVDRIGFYPRLSLPRLMFEGRKGTYYAVEPIDDHPLLVLFFADDEDSNATLRRIWNYADKLTNQKLDCLALYCLPQNQDADQTWHNTNIAVNRSRFPFRWGVLTTASLDKISYLFGDWFFRHELPRFPFALLLDSSGKVACFYPNGSVEPSTVLEDLSLLNADESSAGAALLKIEGRWINRYRKPDFRRLITRMEEVGYDEDLTTLTENERPYLAHQCWQLAIEAESKGDIDEALQLFARAKQLDKQCLLAFLNNADLMRRLANQEMADSQLRTNYRNQAAVDFKVVISLDPHNQAGIIGLAKLAVDQEQMEEAIKLLSDFLSSNPDCFEVHALVGRLQFQQKNYREAARHLLKAYENRPSLPHVADSLGFMYLISGDYELAKRFLTAAHQLQPSERNVIRFLAEAEFANANYAAAIELLDKVIESDPQRDRARKMLAWLLATSPDESDRDGSRALEIIQPLYLPTGTNSLSVMEVHAAGLAEIGRFEEARQVQQSALSLMVGGGGKETYTSDQQAGLKNRLALYERKQAYRMEELSKNPIRPPSATGKSN